MAAKTKRKRKVRDISRLITDLTVRKMNKDQIREHYKQGRYAGASDAHVKGYVEMHWGK